MTPDRSRLEIGTVVWLHGLGESPDSMMAVAQRMNPTRLTIRGVFPAAPLRPIGRVGRKLVTGWYEQSVYRYQHMDLDSALDTESWLRPIVDREVESAANGKVVVAGFSQGAAMALMLALRSPRVAGVMLYAGHMPVEMEELLTTTRSLPAGVPVWIGHGVEDLIVPIESGVHVRNKLTEWGYPVTWQPYHGEHEAFGGVTLSVLAFLRHTVGMQRVKAVPKEVS